MSSTVNGIPEGAANIVNVTKIATPAGGVVSFFGFNMTQDAFLGWAGLVVTITFGLLGVGVNWYFKYKEDRRREAEHHVALKKATSELNGG